MKSKLSYEQQDHHLQELQNSIIFENNRLTKWTLVISIIVGIFSAVSAIADVLQLYA